MKWVTWENVAVDRMACAWLVRKYIDSQAEFIFIPAGARAYPEDAEPFDIPGVRYSHHRGHCTFYTFLREHDLKDPILQRMARIIDEADVIQEAQVEPLAPGLDAICRGLRQISQDDETALRHGALVYDALYTQLSLDPSL